MSGVPFSSIYPTSPGVDAATGLASEATGPVANDLYPGMPVGASPIHKDLRIAAAGTYVLWDPGAGTKFTLASAFLSCDAAMSVTVFDESDIQGSRPIDGYFGANGGASPNMVPVPYESKLAGNRLRVTVVGVGNCRIRVSGWTRTAA